MLENFSTDINNSVAPTAADALTSSDSRWNKMILVGSPVWIKSVIRRLHCLGFAEVGAWSRLVPTKNREETIAILMRLKNED